MREVTYRLEDIWHIRWEKERLWAFVGDFRYDNWWPGVAIERLVTGGSGDSIGDGYVAFVRTGLASTIRLRALVVDCRPPDVIELRLTGHLTGRALISLQEAGEESTALRCEMEVAVRKTWMSLLTPLLRPVFIWNHRRIMKAGCAGLAAYLENAPTPTERRPVRHQPARG